MTTKEYFDANIVRCSDVYLADGNIYYPKEFIIELINNHARKKCEEQRQLCYREWDEAGWRLDEMADAIRNAPEPKDL